MAQIIGIAGGIGSGKSVVSNLLREKGYQVFDSDKEAKNIMDSDRTVMEQISNLFGSSAYLDGKMDRHYIANKVFNNNELLQQLNHIVHPAVKHTLEHWATVCKDKFVFAESAILFESGLSDLCFKTILVSAPIELRIGRVMMRDNCSEQDVEKRIKSQTDNSILESWADFLISNTSDIANIEKQIDNILHQINLQIEKQ